MKRKVIITAGSLIGMAMIAIGSGWWYFFHTRAGVEFILARLNGIQGTRIIATDVVGTLSGPLQIKRVEVDDKYVNVIIEDVQLQLTPAALLAQTLRAQYVRVGRAAVIIKPFNEPPSTKPLRFLPAWLRVSVGRLEVATARVTLPNGTALDATQVAATNGVSLTSQHLDVTGVSLQSPYVQLAGDVSLLAQRPVGLKSHVLAVPAIHNPEWRIDLSTDGNIESMHVDAHVTAPNDAVLTGTLVRDGKDWRLKGDLTSEQFALTPWLKNPPFSLTKVDLQIDATIERIAANGSMTLPEVDALPMHIDASGKIGNRVVVIDRSTIKPEKSDVIVDSQATIRFGKERPLIDLQTQWKNLRWPLRAIAKTDNLFHSAQGSATLSGSMPYKISADADVTLANNEIAHITTSGEVSDKSIVLDRYTLAALKGKAQGKASAVFDSRAWTFDIDATHINPEFFNTALPGAIDIKAQTSGTGFNGRMFTAKIDSLHGTLRGLRINGHGSLGRNEDGWYTKSFTASFGDNRVALDGQFGRVNNLTWHIDVPQLKQIVPDAVGELHSQGAVHGERAIPQLRGQLTAAKLQIGDWHVGTLAVDADVDVTGHEQSTLQADATQFGFGVVNFDTVHMTGHGTDVAHQLQLNATAPAESYETVPTLEWHANGSYAKRAWHGTFSAVKFSDHYGRKPVLEVPDAPVAISADKGQVQQWCLILSDRKLCVDGAWNRTDGWRLKLAGDEVELNIFDTLLGDKTQLEGRWQLNGQFSSTPHAAWVGDAHFRLTDFNVLYAAIEDAQERVKMGTGRLDVTATPQQLDTALSVITSGTTSIEAGMQLKRLANAGLMQSPLTATFKARTSDANVLPLLFTDLDRAAGTLQADLNATGTLEFPSISGRVQLQNGELDLYRYNLALRTMGTTVDVADNRINFTGSGKLGQGTLSLQGQLEWQGGKAKGQMQIQGADLLVADLAEYRVVASPNLLFAIDGKRVDASGDVVIPSAHLQPVDLRGAVQRSPDARLVGMQPTTMQSEYQVHSDINVRLGDDVQLNTFGLQGKLTGNVNTTTRPGEPPRGRGELRVQSGRYQAYGQDLDIERGRLLFESSPLDNPGLDILAIRTIEEQRVGVNVRGTLRVPRMSFYSEPSLTQSQTVAYLLTGKPLEDMRTQDATAVSNASNALALQGGGLIASQIGRRIGLEAVSVESSGLNDTSLVLGKFLSPRLFVSYGISLTESINTFKARYSISDHWLLKGESGQNQSGDVEFRIER
jgi:translocation and assembly module TamB